MAVVWLGRLSRIGIGHVPGAITRIRRQFQLRRLLILLPFPKHEHSALVELLERWRHNRRFASRFLDAGVFSFVTLEKTTASVRILAPR
jgi:hypothetical protein